MIVDLESPIAPILPAPVEKGEIAIAKGFGTKGLGVGVNLCSVEVVLVGFKLADGGGDRLGCLGLE